MAAPVPRWVPAETDAGLPTGLMAPVPTSLDLQIPKLPLFPDAPGLTVQSFQDSLAVGLLKCLT